MELIGYNYLHGVDQLSPDVLRERTNVSAYHSALLNTCQSLAAVTAVSDSGRQLAGWVLPMCQIDMTA